MTLLIPVLTLIAAVWSGSLLFLNYVHVLTGGTWTGVDLFMGLVMSRVLKGLRPEVRAEFIKKLVPIMLFFMPALASVAITADVYLAKLEGPRFLLSTHRCRRSNRDHTDGSTFWAHSTE